MASLPASPARAAAVQAVSAPRLRLPLLISTLAAAVLLAACGAKQQEGDGHGGAPGGAMPPMPVSVRSVKLESVPLTLEAVGQAEGSKEVEVRARVSGLIERQLYQEGERVKAGAPLYQIERAPFEIALQQARANLGQQTAQLEQARREAQRLKPLAEQQAVSQREYDDATSGLRLAEAAVAAAQAQVREAELNLSYTSVTAPIAGISGRSQKSQGSLVSPGTDSLLTTVTQTDPIWVRFAFSEAEQSQLRDARQAQVRLLDANGKPLAAQGRLNFAGSTVDARVGTVQLRAEFPNADLAVLPGQFVRAQVVAGQVQGFLVPKAAVMQTDKGTLVWTVRDGKATPAPVEVGNWVGGDWVVRKGLNEGDQVIVDNLMKLRPGAPVKPQAAGAAPGAAPASAASAPAAASAASAGQ
ncbi:efflux RND transporter periplasmic adaptor subunit [Eleftheria terrae]|uniref:efflux RND transporter periplasmic adaptor subunit n=1 Tax=Eleftheria terrae TaxID=1597781 RepID=UPI00263B0D44|nr:efflux RND transporter periplasmic adaptor subunit [Eleftheria terrae]WKB51478.1 efflux RND transporter periplasmic adaptor subunit [Eleftheria terrae]